MKEYLLRNLCDGPRDYPLRSGGSIYFGSKGRSTGITKIAEEEISEAIKAAESKGLLAIEEMPEEEATE